MALLQENRGQENKLILARSRGDFFLLFIYRKYDDSLLAVNGESDNVRGFEDNARGYDSREIT